jgi:hypothetical protein
MSAKPSLAYELPVASSPAPASELANVQINRVYWPPWIFPPPEFQPIDVDSYVPLPPIGTTVVVTQYTVQKMSNGVIKAYANNFVGGGFEEGSGDVIWQILRNGVPIKGYNDIVASLANPASPFHHPSGFRIFENDIIQLTVTNEAVVVAGQLIGGRLAGWQYPKRYDDPRSYV